jgi:hypothetical protein
MRDELIRWVNASGGSDTTFQVGRTARLFVAIMCCHAVVALPVGLLHLLIASHQDAQDASAQIELQFQPGDSIEQAIEDGRIGEGAQLLLKADD